jgi:hypothetical protein
MPQVDLCPYALHVNSSREWNKGGFCAKLKVVRIVVKTVRMGLYRQRHTSCCCVCVCYSPTVYSNVSTLVAFRVETKYDVFSISQKSLAKKILFLQVLITKIVE